MTLVISASMDALVVLDCLVSLGLRVIKECAATVASAEEMDSTDYQEKKAMKEIEVYLEFLVNAAMIVLADQKVTKETMAFPEKEVFLAAMASTV